MGEDNSYGSREAWIALTLGIDPRELKLSSGGDNCEWSQYNHPEKGQITLNDHLLYFSEKRRWWRRTPKQLPAGFETREYKAFSAGFENSDLNGEKNKALRQAVRQEEGLGKYFQRGISMRKQAGQSREE